MGAAARAAGPERSPAGRGAASGLARLGVGRQTNERHWLLRGRGDEADRVAASPAQGRVQLGALPASPPVTPFTLFRPAIQRVVPGRRRNGRVSIGSLLSPQAPFVLFANPIVRTIRRPRRGASKIGTFLGLPPALPFTFFTAPLVRSVRRPRRGLAWMARLAWPQAAASTTSGRYYTDPNRASAVLISTADLGYAQTDPNSATSVVVHE